MIEEPKRFWVSGHKIHPNKMSSSEEDTLIALKRTPPDALANILMVWMNDAADLREIDELLADHHWTREGWLTRPGMTK